MPRSDGCEHLLRTKIIRNCTWCCEGLRDTPSWRELSSRSRERGAQPSCCLPSCLSHPLASRSASHCVWHRGRSPNVWCLLHIKCKRQSCCRPALRSISNRVSSSGGTDLLGQIAPHFGCLLCTRGSLDPITCLRTSLLSCDN